MSLAPKIVSVSRSPIARSAPFGRVTDERMTRLSGLTKICISGPNRQAAYTKVPLISAAWAHQSAKCETSMP